MHFVIHALDRPGTSGLRSSTRERHLEYLAGFELVFAGPLLDDDQEMCGSLIVVELPSKSAAEKLAAGDPYAEVGLFSQVTITGLRPVIGLGAA